VPKITGYRRKFPYVWKHCQMTPAALDVDFYLSSTDGPTLRLAGTSGGMEILRDACKRLAGGEPSVSVSDLDGVSLSVNVEAVEFRLGGEDGPCRRTGEPPSFLFDGDRHQREARARLLDPLVQNGTPGTFQYLEPNIAAPGICVEASVDR
jgi:hypothetical protein